MAYYRAMYMVINMGKFNELKSILVRSIVNKIMLETETEFDMAIYLPV